MTRSRLFTAILIGILSVGLGPAAFAQGSPDPIKRADELWRTRDGSRPGSLQAISLLQDALKRDPNNFELHWRVARACYWICDRTEDPAIEKQWGSLGIEHAERALALKPERIEGHYYLALCTAEYGSHLSTARALAEGLGTRLRDQIEYCYRHAPMFDYAGPCITLGKFYQDVPWPYKDYERAEMAYKQALQAYPWVYRARVYLAELYVDMDKPDQARQVLSVDLACPTDISDHWECEFFKKQATNSYR